MSSGESFDVPVGTCSVLERISEHLERVVAIQLELALVVFGSRSPRLALPCAAKRYMLASEVSAQIRVPVATLAAWRSEHKGPPYRKIGKRAVYDPEALQAWVEQDQSNGRRS